MNIICGGRSGAKAMETDNDKVNEAVLALLWLTRCDTAQAWKGHDWDAMDRLYKKGMINDPKNKNKSVWFTVDGLAESKRLFEKLFAKPGV